MGYLCLVTSNSEIGIHGYYNEATETRPFFFANGPALMSKPKLEPLNNLELFLLFCKILDLQYPIRNDTVSHLIKCLKKHQQDIIVIAYRLIFVATTISMTLVVIIRTIMMFYKRT